MKLIIYICIFLYFNYKINSKIYQISALNSVEWKSRKYNTIVTKIIIRIFIFNLYVFFCQMQSDNKKGMLIQNDNTYKFCDKHFQYIFKEISMKTDFSEEKLLFISRWNLVNLLETEKSFIFEFLRIAKS